MPIELKESYINEPDKYFIVNKNNLYIKEYPKNIHKDIKIEDLKNAVYISSINSYLLENNINLVYDIYTYDPLYKKCASTDIVYTEIKEFGKNLMFLGKKYFKKILGNKIPVEFVKVRTSKGKYINLDMYLVNNSLFQKYYKEDLENDIFVDNKTPLKNYKVPEKKIGLKYKGVNKRNITPNTYIKTLRKRYTFGFELESISGYLPYHLTTQFPYSAVYDGSLKHKDDGISYGLEYVTEVLEGDYGLKTLKFLCIELSKRCIINYQCSVHLHLGNFNFTKENLVYLYTTLYTIQKELFLWFPIERRASEYAKKLPNLGKIDFEFNDPNRDYYLNNLYLTIFSKVGNSNIGNTVNRSTDHPFGPKCRFDHSTMRYCWVNFVPAIFNTRGNNVYTIEFRIHEANYNYYNLKNWLLVCMSFLNAVENHKFELHKELHNNTLNMQKILSWAYSPSVVSDLMNFYDIRANNPNFNKIDHDYEYMPLDDTSLKIQDL